MIDPRFKALYTSMGDVETAHLRNPKFTEDEYAEALVSPEYALFLKDINDRFVMHLDQLLIYEQYESFKMLEDIRAGREDIKNLKAVSDHWHKTLAITSPIIERLARVSKEAETIQNLKLVIK